jgi:hypothetical protein
MHHDEREISHGSIIAMAEPPWNEGFIDQDQIGRFSVKRSHNQYMISIKYHILTLSKINTH